MLQALQRFADSHLRPNHGQYDARFDTDTEVFWTEDMLAEAAAEAAVETPRPVYSSDPIPLHRPSPARPVFGRRGL